MFSFQQYVLAESVDQAYELNQKKNNIVLGGTGWLKTGRKSYGTAIDLSGLGLDTITENEEEFSIGCMVTLRQIETHEGLNRYFNHACREAVRHIVGIQFRNLATVGGSIYGRFGFSDVLTCFLAMDSYVELFSGGIVPLREFAQMKYDRDILIRLIVKKDGRRTAYQSFRLQSTDFPVVAVCAAELADGSQVAAVGARPARAVLRELENGTWKEPVVFGSNMRAGREYRSFLADTLLNRALEEIKNGTEPDKEER